MGIDSQGINRGKCSCGECVEFVRGSGVLCGYCECVPVRHEKVTDPNSSTTSTTQDGQTTQPRNNLWNEMIFYNRDFMKQYHDAPNNKKNTVPGHGYFAKLASFEEEHCEKGDLYMEYRKMSCQEKNGELCEYCRAFFKSYFRYTYSTTLSQLQQTS